VGDDQAPGQPDEPLDASLGVAINVAGDVIGSLGREVGQVPLVGEQLDRGIAEGAAVAHNAAEHVVDEAISEQLSSRTPRGLVDTFESSADAGPTVLTPATYPGAVPEPDMDRDGTPPAADPPANESVPAPPAPVVEEHPALGSNRDNPFPDWDQPAGDSALPTLTPDTYPGESPFPADDDDLSPLTGAGAIDESDAASASADVTTDADADADNPYQNDDYFSYTADSSGGADSSQEGAE
jgi:hypothetical protein